MNLPKFKYHPDPIATGSVAPSEATCLCCGMVRGYIYTGPAYAEDDLDEAICPWCIADGSAHRKLHVEFADPEEIGGLSGPNTTPGEVVAEVTQRTPGFAGWQQERWLTCCNDAMAYLGAAGFKELSNQWSGAVPAIQADCGLEGDEWDHFFRALHKEQGPTAYVFQCLHCSRIDAYQDCD